ncbi:hypothetical protein DCS_05013 [Drechmeria coniospora]|uniref:Uncharacterized protein n=1 Tax=Drechmeria coniospora TaxID=98403 RepID=A0A151GLM2_DRECN|nr:hypothetical protein DCS_05013 [Drechmeria coniospora]KYK58000.1 hypothetical protein DCS_05013 [Drechmeria coniospora]
MARARWWHGGGPCTREDTAGNAGMRFLGGPEAPASVSRGGGDHEGVAMGRDGMRRGGGL